MQTQRITCAALVAVALWAAPVGAAEKYEEIAVMNGGTISGRVVWTGAAPTLEDYAINKNVEVCAHGGVTARPSDRLLISADGGVANAVVYLKDVTSGKPMPNVAATLNQKGCRYEPHVQVVPRKTKLTMSSEDDILHNIHMFGAATYNIPFSGPDSITKSMRKAGVVRIQCDAGHSWMNGYVHVANHPYYAVTDETGAFTLTDVPPGSYAIVMWHEHWEVTKKFEKDGVVTGYEFADPVELSQQVEVAPGGDATVTFELSGS